MNEYTHPDIAAELTAAGAQSHYVEVDGIHTHYIEAGAGPLLVLVHVTWIRIGNTQSGATHQNELVDQIGALNCYTQAARKAIDVIRRSKITYFKDVISSIKQPTLVVGGKEDQVAVLARAPS